MSAEATSDASVQNDFLKVETTGIEMVPQSERSGRLWELGGMWAGAFMNYASLLTGSLLITFGLGIPDALLAIAVGAALAAVVLGLVSITGPRGGVPQIVFSRLVFGYHGAYLAGALTLFLAVGWFAVDCVIATNALSQLLQELGIASSQALHAVMLLVVVAVSMLIAVYGHRTVVVFERFGAVAFLTFCVVLLAVLAPRVHWHLTASVHGSAHVGAWILGASVTFALVASWFSFAADYSRYLPARTEAGGVVWWVTLGAGLPTMLLGALGVVLFSMNTRTGDLLTTIVQQTPKPLALAFLLFVALGMVWANYLDVYTAGLVTLALDVPLRRWQTAVLAGIVGGLLAYYALFVSSFYTAYTNFLLVTYIWAPAWAAIVVLTLYESRQRAYPAETFFRRTGVRAPAVIALLIGTAAAVPFVNSSLWQSPLALNLLHGADISGFVSFVAGGLVYLALTRSTRKQFWK
ncbi:MAG TPA: cytosine permease [Chloroflexota bacterium]